MGKRNFKSYTRKYSSITRNLKEKVIISANKDMYPDSSSGEYICVFDTGATSSAINTKIAKECNLTPINKVRVNTAGGLRIQDVYLVNIQLPTGVIKDVMATAMESINGTDVLIGMDIITLGDFAITNLNGKTTFSFRIPSCETIDYCKEADKLNIRALKNAIQEAQKQGKKTCPCGSGKPYKYCHGKEKINELKEKLELLEKGEKIKEPV